MTTPTVPGSRPSDPPEGQRERLTLTEARCLLRAQETIRMLRKAIDEAKDFLRDTDLDAEDAAQKAFLVLVNVGNPRPASVEADPPSVLRTSAPEGNGAYRENVMKAALVRELQGARRAQIESEKQGRFDWARHFERMEKRITVALLAADIQSIINPAPASVEADPPSPASSSRSPEGFITDAMLAAALGVLDQRGWSPPNARTFGSDVRDALAAAEKELDVTGGERDEAFRKALGWQTRAGQAEAKLAAAQAAATDAINALMALSCTVQNDRGSWKIRKGADMQALVDAVNRTVPIARAALSPGGSGKGEAG
jgi:hypothetical protein